MKSVHAILHEHYADVSKQFSADEKFVKSHVGFGLGLDLAPAILEVC